MQYAYYISKIVVVEKKQAGKWRVCVDFINLNKACPNDDYPIPKIYVMVDAMAWYELLSILDAFLDTIRSHWSKWSYNNLFHYRSKIILLQSDAF